MVTKEAKLYVHLLQKLLHEMKVENNHSVDCDHTYH